MGAPRKSGRSSTPSWRSWRWRARPGRPGRATRGGLQVTADGLTAGGAYQDVDPARFTIVPTVPVSPIAGSESNEDFVPVTSEGIDFAGVRSLMPLTRFTSLIAVRQVFGLRYMHHAIATNV